jgi:glycine oxidase
MDESSVILAKKRKETAKDLWQNFATWDIIDNSKEWELMSPTGFWIFDNLSALIHPRLACLSLAQALNKKGCEFLLEGKNQGKVIWATGVHDLSRISQKFEKNFGNGVKGQAALFKLKKPRSAQLFAETLHFIPHLDGTLAVGSTSENSFEHSDTNDGNLQALIIKASNILPELKGKDPICTWANVRPRSRSRAPVLGEHPLYPSEFIMNGGFKIGLGMAPQMGKVFSEFLLQNINNIPTEFLPSVSL